MSVEHGRRGLLEPMLNLRCSHTDGGHRAYSPTPNYWRGRECMRAVGENKRCRRKLRLIPRSERG